MNVKGDSLSGFPARTQHKFSPLANIIVVLHSQNRATRQIASAGIHCKTAVWKRL